MSLVRESESLSSKQYVYGVVNQMAEFVLTFRKNLN